MYFQYYAEVNVNVTELKRNTYPLIQKLPFEPIHEKNNLTLLKDIFNECDSIKYEILLFQNTNLCNCNDIYYLQIRNQHLVYLRVKTYSKNQKSQTHIHSVFY